MTRAVIYARISQDSDQRGQGVERQLTDCRKLAHARGWTIVEEHVDNDVSATRSKSRPEYQRMLESIRAGLVDALVVYDVDRLTRTPRELEDVIDLADAHGLALASVGGEIDLATAQGRLTARIKGSVARHETDQLSRRVKRKIEEKAAAGEPHGLVPYGFQRVPIVDDKGRRTGARDVPHPEESKVILEAAHRILAGESLRSAATRANASGSTAPRGGRWTSTTLKQVLMRPTNAGLRRHRGQIVGKSTTAPILSEDEFYRLTAILSDPRRLVHLGGPPRHLLTGIAECGFCGGKMRRLKGAVRNGKTGPDAYGCRECFKVRRSVELVDGVVNGVIVALLERPRALAALSKGDPTAADDARAHADALEARLAMAADQFAEGNITGEQLARITARLRPELDETRAKVARLAPSSLVADLAGPDAGARWAAADLWTRREVIDQFMKVTILPAGPGRGRDPESIRVEPKGVNTTG